MRIVPAIHAGEFLITLDTLRHLLETQVPWLSKHSLRPLVPGGTDHVMVQIGDSFVARLPRHTGAVHATKVEREWLSRVARSLSMKVPKIVYSGHHDYQYPAPWSILSWVPGTPATPLDSSSLPEAGVKLAADLAKVVMELRSIRIPDHVGVLPQAYRTQSLSDRDPYVRAALDQCDDVFDRGKIIEAWEHDLLAYEQWSGPPVAAHGDLQPSNIIIDPESNAITGIIDWGGLSFGDPAVDLLPAWMLLEASSRQTFRSLCGADEGTWRRGRAWALSIGIVAYPYYRHSRPDHTAISKRQVEQVLADVAANA